MVRETEQSIVDVVPIDLTDKQRELQRRLVQALHEALPIEACLEKAERQARSCYKTIAELLIDLRHEFRGPNLERYDLRGRSSGYRSAVREAYAQAGTDIDAPIPKRLTAGVAYWVKKILIERYNEKTLSEYGIIKVVSINARRDPSSTIRTVEELPEDPTNRLRAVIGMLNTLVIDPRLSLSEDVVRSAFRAVLLLHRRLKSLELSDLDEERLTRMLG